MEFLDSFMEIVTVRVVDAYSAAGVGKGDRDSDEFYKIPEREIKKALAELSKGDWFKVRQGLMAINPHETRRVLRDEIGALDVDHGEPMYENGSPHVMHDVIGFIEGRLSEAVMLSLAGEIVRFNVLNRWGVPSAF